MKLEQLTFDTANELIMDIYQNQREIYNNVGPQVLQIRDYNAMLKEVKDNYIKNIILNKRKEVIDYVLCVTKQREQND